MADDSSSSNPLEQARSLSHVPWCSVYEDMICGRPCVESLTCGKHNADADRRFSTWLVPELEKRFMDVRRLCHAYSTAPIPADFSMQTLQQERAIQLQRMLGKVSSDTTIEPPFYCSYGCNIAISGRIYANIKYAVSLCFRNFRAHFFIVFRSLTVRLSLSVNGYYLAPTLVS